MVLQPTEHTRTQQATLTLETYVQDHRNEAQGSCTHTPPA